MRKPVMIGGSLPNTERENDFLFCEAEITDVK